MEHLYNKLAKYAEGQDYPYHMPGHKRRAFGEMSPEIYQLDITEIDGFDNLHAPEGVILDLEKRVANLYGAEESFCLVGGSTCGILSAISAAVPMGGHILMARNCHKSAYHAVYLRQLRVTYLYANPVEDYGIWDGISPGQVREALEKEPDISAVLIVSPTYEGRISPVKEIARVVHEFGKILIVDEAHGAHLGLVLQPKALDADEADTYPQNSCAAGADLVIHSVHKTLPAMTQTALLHVNGSLVNRNLLKRFLKIYQSSSPSYVLMASIDNAMSMVEKDGQELFGNFYNRFEKMLQTLEDCRKLRILRGPATPVISSETGHGVVCGQAMGKLVIDTSRSGITGQQLYDMLREEYHLQPEMAAGNYVLAMFTIGDTQEGYDRMCDALLKIDGQLQSRDVSAKSSVISVKCGETSQDGKPTVDVTKHPEDCSQQFIGSGLYQPTCAIAPAKAWDMSGEVVPLSESLGRISGDFVNLYPPGVPILVPGERIDQMIADEVKKAKLQGLNVQGISGEQMLIMCVVETIDHITEEK